MDSKCSDRGDGKGHEMTVTKVTKYPGKDQSGPVLAKGLIKVRGFVV